MAEVAITLKLTASEFQALRAELMLHRDSLRDDAKRAISRDSKHALTRREAQITFLLEKLG